MVKILIDLSKEEDKKFAENPSVKGEYAIDFSDCGFSECKLKKAWEIAEKILNGQYQDVKLYDLNIEEKDKIFEIVERFADLQKEAIRKNFCENYIASENK